MERVKKHKRHSTDKRNRKVLDSIRRISQSNDKGLSTQRRRSLGPIPRSRKLKNNRSSIDRVRRRKSLCISKKESTVMDSIRRISTNDFNGNTKSKHSKRRKSKIPESELSPNMQYARDIVESNLFQKSILGVLGIFITNYQLADDIAVIFSTTVSLFIWVLLTVYSLLQGLLQSLTMEHTRSKKPRKRTKSKRYSTKKKKTRRSLLSLSRKKRRTRKGKRD